MKKQLNADAVLNELKGASVFFPAKEVEQNAERTAITPLSKLPIDECGDAPSAREKMSDSAQGAAANQPSGKPKDQLVDQSASLSSTQLVDESTEQSTSQSFDTSTVLGRPKAFYITKRQDEDLDRAVEKLQKKIGEKINQKIDRSTVMRLLLEENNLASDETISKLAHRLARRLISQLSG